METKQSWPQEQDLAKKAEQLAQVAAQIIKMVPPEKTEQCLQLVQELIRGALT